MQKKKKKKHPQNFSGKVVSFVRNGTLVQGLVLEQQIFLNVNCAVIGSLEMVDAALVTIVGESD